LEVRGKKELVDEFKKRASSVYQYDTGEVETALSLAKFYPEPDYTKIKVKSTFPEITKRKYAKKGQEWWDWRVQNWGTKWDVEAEIVKEEEFKNGNKVIVFNFDSAWSPPVEWLKKVAKDYPGLSFKLKYEEPGVGFRGVAQAINGETSDQCFEY